MGFQVRLAHELVNPSRLNDAGNAGYAKEYKRESETGLFDGIIFLHCWPCCSDRIWSKHGLRNGTKTTFLGLFLHCWLYYFDHIWSKHGLRNGTKTTFPGLFWCRSFQ